MKHSMEWNTRRGWNRRQQTLIWILCGGILLTAITVIGGLISEDMLTTRLELRNLPPSISHLLGTDWLGRDMLARTLQGLSISILIGLLASVTSVVIALLLGMASATLGKTVDAVITWLIDLFLGLPHLVAMILIAFALGGGIKGVIIGVALTHWTSMARIVRAEILQLRTAPYVLVARQLGKSRWWIATRHLLPHLVPQLLVGLVLLFPHAILHEAAITFLGLGLSAQEPAIGIILSESMQYLVAGMWWLALFPGLALLMLVRLFDIIGDQLRLLLDPHSAQH